MTFNIGQRVVCVTTERLIELQKAPPDRYVFKGLDGLKEGEVYTIRGIFSDPYHACFNFGSVYLEEIRRPFNHDGIEAPYLSVRFRPVQETGMKILRGILEDLNGRSEKRSVDSVSR